MARTMLKRLLHFSGLLVIGLLLSWAPPQPPPNIIIILADDMGYSDIGSFGSEIKTPHLDALAKGGLRLTQFYNASRCCPTRAALLTGLYPHQAGVGHMVNQRAHPSYWGRLNENCLTIAEALKMGGYNTFMAGKWHVGQQPEHWPRRRGFDRYFGLIDGANSHFGNRPYRPNQQLTYLLNDTEYTPGPDFYSSDTYTDYALEFIQEHQNQDKPFFLYLAFTAPHWPLHARPADIARYQGKYQQGYDRLRQARYQRQLALGIINKTTKLSPRDEDLPAWESLTPEQKNAWEEKMAVYAAMVDRLDQNVGRLQQSLKTSGADKNTLIIFLSDNGGSHESIAGTGFTPAIRAANQLPASNPASFTAYELAGANVSNTPFRKYKHLEHEGGIATPFIAHYPKLIKPGQLNHQPAHITDLMATCLELAGVKYPETYRGHALKPLAGVSLVPLLRGQPWAGHPALFFEHEGNRAVRQGEWKLVSGYPENQWELYNLATDRTELANLSARYPEKVKALANLYDDWADRAGVVPYAQLLKLDKQNKK